MITKYIFNIKILFKHFYPIFKIYIKDRYEEINITCNKNNYRNYTCAHARTYVK